MPDDLQDLEIKMSQATTEEFIRNRKAIIANAVSDFENPKKRRKHYDRDVNEIPCGSWELYVKYVAKFIEAKGTAETSALGIEEACGGTKTQVRQACNELIGQYLVLRTGKARATRYYWSEYSSNEIWLEHCKLSDLDPSINSREVVETTTTTTTETMIALPYGFNDMVSLHPPNPAKLQDLPETPDSAVLKDIPPRPDETIYEGGGVKIFVKDNNVIVSCLQLTHSYSVSAALLASCAIHFDEKHRDRFFAIACLLRDLYDDLDTYPQDILPKFSCGPNLHGGQEFTFVRFSGETFPLDNGYQIETVKKVNLEGDPEDNFYQACLDYLVDLLKRKNRDLAKDDCISTIGVQDLVKVDHCCCTKPQSIAAELTAWEADQSVRLKAANARGDNMTLLAIGHWVRRLLHNWFSRAWRGTHAPDCKFIKYQNDLQEIENAKIASTQENARVLKVRKDRYAEIHQKSLDHIGQHHSVVPEAVECVDDDEEEEDKTQFRLGTKTEIISFAWLPGLEKMTFAYDRGIFDGNPYFEEITSVTMGKNRNLLFFTGWDSKIRDLVKSLDPSGIVQRQSLAIIIRWPTMHSHGTVVLDHKRLDAGKFEVLPWSIPRKEYLQIVAAAEQDPHLMWSAIKLIPSRSKLDPDWAFKGTGIDVLENVLSNDAYEKLSTKILRDAKACIQRIKNSEDRTFGKRFTRKVFLSCIQRKAETKGISTQALNLEIDNWAPITPQLNRVVQPSLCSQGNYQGRRFENLKYNNQDLSRANFQGCRFVNCTFKACDFEKADLQGCSLTNCTFLRCDFERACLQGAQLIACNFNGCDFERADLTGCMASPQTVFSNCDVELAQTHGSNIRF